MASPSSSASRYPYPSLLINSSSFVSIKLSSAKNYSMWETQILCLIESQELDGFIDGTIPAPPSSGNNRDDTTGDVEAATTGVQNEEYRMWRRSDRLVKGLILGSLHVDVLATVVGLSTARDVWTKLKSALGPDSQGYNEEDSTTKEHKEETITPEKEATTGQQGTMFMNYPYPSMVNVANFVRIKLAPNNYAQWSTQIFSLLNSQDLMSFIMAHPPAKFEEACSIEFGQQISEDYKHWQKTDLLVKGWILGSISEEVILMVSSMDSSRDIMGKLEEMFVSDITSHIIFKKPIPPPPVQGEARNDNSRYLPLYKATLMGDWETAKKVMDRDRDAATASIARNQEAVIHLAVGTGKAIHFLEKLVGYLPMDALTLRNDDGDTALCIAAAIGNTKGAKILIEKNPALLHIRNDGHLLPLQLAVEYGQRDTFLYLQTVSCDNDYDGQDGADILALLVTHGYIDIALDLIKRYPHVARLESRNYTHPLCQIASQGILFRSGYHLNFLQNYIYSRIPVKFENCFDGSNAGGIGVGNPGYNSRVLMHDRGHSVRVPAVKNLRGKKLVHHQAVQLVKCLCQGIKESSNIGNAYIRCTSVPVTRAASLGIFEVVEEIVDIIPIAFWSRDTNGYDIAELAVLNRCEKVFNLIYQMSGYRQQFALPRRVSGNTILHLAGRLAPQHKLNLVSGAALQMQRELQWFQEVAKLYNPIHTAYKNSNGESASIIFTEEHQELVKAGEKWMKDTANSCTIAAALIITVVFAAAITVPGGNNGNTGLPIFSKGRAFWLFAISNAISLFTSTTSLLMFLSILTARYAEQDFLHALPKRLVFGLLTLFLSISSMIMAFSTAVYLVFGESKGWIIIPLIALSSLPITSFVTLQFPLLIDVYSSTYGRGIFGKQNDRPFH